MVDKSGFVPAICTRCGAPIKVDPSQEAAVCEYCGSAFVTSKAINKYRISIFQKTENNTFNVQVGKKGLAQSAFEFAAKYDENRAVVRAAKEKKEAEKAAAVAAEQAWQREQIRIKEEKKKSFFKNIGLFFLWAYFFPIMAVIAYLNYRSEKQQNEKRMANGYEPRELTTLPYFSVAIGALVFVSFVITLFGANHYSAQNTNSNTFNQSSNTIEQVSPKQSTSDIDYETVTLNGRFDEGTYIEETTIGVSFPLTNNWEQKGIEETDNATSLQYIAESGSAVALLQVSYGQLDKSYTGEEIAAPKEVVDSFWSSVDNESCDITDCNYKRFSGNGICGIVSDGEGIIATGKNELKVYVTVYVFFNKDRTGIYCFAVMNSENTERSVEEYRSELEMIVAGTKFIE